MEATMYETLLELPLLQGLGKNDLTNILAKVKFHFRKYAAGHTIVRQGDPCRELHFILNGEVKSTFTDERYDYSIQEVMKGPNVIEPYTLFGMQTNYSATYEAHTAVDVISIEKSFVVDELNNYEVFRFNFMNIISNRAQVAYEKMRHHYVGDIRQKVVDFISLRVQTETGPKGLRTRMDNLAACIGEPRLAVSRELHAMQSEGLLTLGRKEIPIPEMNTLLQTKTISN
jgi:CRP-like cAMP-binding protein